MRRIVVLVAVFLILVNPVNAQFLEDLCSVDSVDVTNSIDGTDAHVKLLYRFECSPAVSANLGQMTKMLISVPYTDVRNLEAEDPYGSMKVLEGPEYVHAETGAEETDIGVIFRRGLLITDEANMYSVAVEFDTTSLVKSSETGYSLKTEDLVGNPKVTIISGGITETTLTVTKINYELKLPDGSGITEISPAACSIQASKVTCNELSRDSFNKVEVKWTKGGVSGITEKIKGYTERLIPRVSDFLGSIRGKVSELMDKTK